MTLRIGTMTQAARFCLILATAAAVVLAWPSQALARSAVSAAAGQCRATVHGLVRGYGSPDDVAVVNGRIFSTDLGRGVLVELHAGRRQVVARGLKTPEGIAPWGHDRLAVVEQGLNRIDLIRLPSGRRRVLITLSNQTSLEGVDGIAKRGRSLIVPDSPYGTIYRYRNGNLRLVASGFQRPTDAVPYRHGLAVADENAHTVSYLRKGAARVLASVPTPDDVTVAGGRLLAVTLGDASLWEIRPHVRRLARFGDPQGLATLSRSSVVVADSGRNELYRVELRC